MVVKVRLEGLNIFRAVASGMSTGAPQASR
jgi:hypothetical protein